MNRKFFAGIEQAEARVAGKKIKVPVFYYDASSITAIFPARMGAVKEALPTPDYHPLSIAPGIAVVGVTALTYRKTSIGPYNELAVAIPMLFKRRALPGVSLLGQFLRNEFHVYIRHLPVTTRIALDGGVIVYNYPKFLSRIVFTERADSILVTLEEKGERILTLRGSKIPAKKSQIMRYVTYPFKDGYAHEAPVLINALEGGMSLRRSAASIDLGSRHPVAGELNGLLLSRRPITYIYQPRFQAVLYGPSRLV